MITMYPTEPAFNLKGITMLLRFVAVVCSSVAAVLSTAFPLLFHPSLSWFTIVSITFMLLIGAILIQGVLTHAFNDLTDHKSGTDQHSPGLLSGGSRVLQTGNMSVQMLIQLGIGVSIFLLFITAILILFGYTKLAILTLVGIWGAGSYSLKPFRLAYYPFVGEWLSLFPTLFLLGIAAPWLLLDHVPLWAWQNSLVNTLVCLAWVMVHHIPDRQADRQARPSKRTTVVWAEDFFGKRAAKLPALLYYIFVGILLLWIAFTRPIGGIGAGVVLVYGIYLIAKMNIEDVREVTIVEKRLLLFAFGTALWLGIFI